MTFTSEQLRRIQQLCETYGVRELSLFGSRARGNNRPDSDYDFLVEFDPTVKVTLFTLSGLRLALFDLLGHEVDLVPKSALKARVSSYALSDASLLYAR